ncbi:MAG: hypothetical protein ACP5JG_02915 [Anaerolineae bacterium]
MTRTETESRRSPPLRANAGVLLLSTATLMFEVNLTRLFSVAQFYHFAFMIVSLAMLGFGASGTWLALWPRWGRRRPRVTLAALSLGYGVCAVGAYLLINWVPFDSFSIAWDTRQVAILFLHYLALSLPFFCSGAVLSLLLARHPASAGSLYAVNLVGSALGCLLALVLPATVGGEGIVWLSGVLSAIATLTLLLRRQVTAEDRAVRRSALWLVAAVALVFGFACLVLAIRPVDAVALNISPYKGLSYALQVPDARVVFREWNSFSRVDLVDSPAIRSLPGLSYRYLEPPPPQHGLFVDGGDMSPVLQLPLSLLGESEDDALRFAQFLPTSVGYHLRPDVHALVLAPRGGLEIWTALSQGADRVTAVEPNPLVVDAVGPLYEIDEVMPDQEEPRSFVRRSGEPYELVVLALTAPYRPIRSGAYSLAEDYRYTVEAFRDYVGRLAPDGLLVLSRWVQTPPSESLRAFALAVTAVEQAGGDPDQQIVAFRGYSMMTFLVKRRPFTQGELSTIRAFADERAFDMVYAPDIQVDELNRHNVLDAPIYYTTFSSLVHAADRDAWYAAYTFDVRPPTDNHPFFGHFFRWSQVRQVVAELGKTWQPFGGAGYFVLVVLLVLSLIAAGFLIGVPMVAMRRRFTAVDRTKGWGLDLLYFGLLGIGYLFVEIPLIQRIILFLGHPAYAFTAVLFALLLFSGIGSAISSRVSLRWALAALVGLILIYMVALPAVFDALLGLPWIARLLSTALLLAPGGLLMGIPFPQGLQWFSQRMPGQVPWAWATNGAMSVVASVLSALLALSLGFFWVLLIGALCYAGAAVIAWRWQNGARASSPA